MTLNPFKWFEKRATSTSITWDQLNALLGMGGSTAAGYNVNESTALSVSAVFAAVRAISEDLAKLPFKVYRETPDGGRNVDKKHPLYRLLHDEPNPEMTAITFRQAVTAGGLLWGTGYAEIELANSGLPIALWPIENGRVKVDRPGTGPRRRLRYMVDGKTEIRPENLLIIPGFTMDGIIGKMTAICAKEAIGITLAAERFGASFFGDSAQASGILEVPVSIGSNEPLRQKFLKSIESRHTVNEGGKPNRMMILWDGIKFTQTSVNPDESQFLETRQFQVEDVARWLRVPPWKIGQFSQSKGWNTQEQGSVDYVTDSLMPWAVRWEQETKRKLLADEPDMCAEHSFDALLRGDALTRAQSLEVQYRNGTLNADEWRAIENRNPLPNGDGKKFFIMSNMSTLENIANAEPAANANGNPPVGTNGKSRITN